MKKWELEPAHDHGLELRDRARSIERENGIIESALQLFWWTCVRNYLRFAHRLSITGRENVPKTTPFVMVANHTSHLDCLVLAAAVPAHLRARFFPIAAGDHFFETPALSAFAAFVLNAIPMWRKNCGRQALATLRQRLIDGRTSYALFPEGTRSRTGEMASFRPGLGMLVAETDVPVLPCYLEGCFAAWPTSRKLPRPKKLVLRIGQALVFNEHPNERAGWQQVAKDCEEAVKAQSSCS